jgi:ABC-type cobalamin/Fe3+-siderophores transport system ATPase subunit
VVSSFSLAIFTGIYRQDPLAVVSLAEHLLLLAGPNGSGKMTLLATTIRQLDG